MCKTNHSQSVKIICLQGIAATRREFGTGFATNMGKGIRPQTVRAEHTDSRKDALMKRCALIISDDLKFRDWLGYHVTVQWPKMMLEYSRIANAPMYLDRIEISRYQLIVVQLGFRTAVEFTTCIFLMRVLKLDVHPEIVIISDNPKALQSARSTALGPATCLTTSQLTTSSISATFAKIAQQEAERSKRSGDGAPDISGYTIREALVGTYGATLYRAFSQREGRDVALKVCELSGNNKTVMHQLTLRKEYETLRKLSGEYVALAYDYGEEGDLAYMALEYFPRGTIGNLFAVAGRNASRVAYLRRVAESLRAIHEAGFLHLDLKPNNVMIRADGSPALIDFGISKRIVVARYQNGVSYSLGSPYFMSPEQIRGESLDERSDIYSFGALWFRIFTGQVPFPGRTFEEIRLGSEGSVSPSMGDALKPYQPIVNKTLAGARDQRFSTAQELIDNIDYHFGTATGVHRIPFFEERRKNRLDNAIGMHCTERRRTDFERIPDYALP